MQIQYMQWTRLLFLSLLMLGGAGFSRTDAGETLKFQWRTVEEGIDELRLGDEQVLRYMYAFDRATPVRVEATTKAFHHVFGPGTGKILTKGPGGLYSHHRGLFIGWNKTEVDGKLYDFWHCVKGIVHLRHVKFIEKTANAKRGSMTAEIHWIDPDGKPVISETRSVGVSKSLSESGKFYGWQIDWATTLRSLHGEITLDGDRQHAGFQFRAAQSVADTNGARFLRPKGFTQQFDAFEVDDRRSSDKHIDLGWLAMTFVIEKKRYTVEYFEDPLLPKPSRYSERPYGRFGAFFKTTLTEDNPLTMRYRLHVSSGAAPTHLSIRKRYDTFVAELKSGSIPQVSGPKSSGTRTN